MNFMRSWLGPTNPFQVRRFRMETKAAKTLGIIVGCFICCWFPFFTMYLVTAFCHECIPDLAFSIIFWLGYCNSAINPFIYAAFSRDFRGAFKKIICKVFCRHVEEPPRGIFMALHPRNVTLGAAAVAMAGANSVANNTAVGGQSSSNWKLILTHYDVIKISLWKFHDFCITQIFTSNQFWRNLELQNLPCWHI